MWERGSQLYLSEENYQGRRVLGVPALSPGGVTQHVKAYPELDFCRLAGPRVPVIGPAAALQPASGPPPGALSGASLGGPGPGFKPAPATQSGGFIPQYPAPTLVMHADCYVIAKPFLDLDGRLKHVYAPEIPVVTCSSCDFIDVTHNLQILQLDSFAGILQSCIDGWIAGGPYLMSNLQFSEGLPGVSPSVCSRTASTATCFDGAMSQQLFIGLAITTNNFNQPCIPPGENIFVPRGSLRLTIQNFPGGGGGATLKWYRFGWFDWPTCTGPLDLKGNFSNTDPWDLTAVSSPAGNGPCNTLFGHNFIINVS